MQTVAGQLLRWTLDWPHPTEDVELEVEAGVRLLLRASWQPTTKGEGGALLLVHGLEGSDASPYLLSSGDLAYRAGWHVVRMNMRGCGASLSLCPLLYNAGLTRDLAAVLNWLGARVSCMAVGAFSLGANLSLLTIAMERHALPSSLRALVAVCPPLHMSACADALEKPGNWIYQAHFMRSLRNSYRERQLREPGRYQRGREIGLRTLREFDEVITAHYGGYAGAADYYQRVSPGPRLSAIEIPTLILATDDDPFIPADTLTVWPRPPQVALEITSSGGHVGYVGRSEARGNFWAADRMLAFTETAKADEKQTLKKS